MSSTIVPPTVAAPPGPAVILTAPATSQAGQVDMALGVARNVPEFLASVANIAPSLPAFFAGKSLAMSKTPWVTTLAAVLTYASGKYALGWSDITVETITGVVLFVVSLGMRAITSVPITGLFTRAEGLLSKTKTTSNAIFPTPAANVVPLAVAVLALGLSGCQTAPTTTATATNANGSAITQSENTAGTLYAAYDAADTAWLAYLAATPQNASKAALVKKVSPLRLDARKAIDAFTAAVIAGAATDQAAAAQAAISLFVGSLTGAGITVGS